jgi:hypothetical protein
MASEKRAGSGHSIAGTPSNRGTFACESESSAGRLPRPSSFSGAEFPPLQSAGFGAGGATAVVGLFEFTLRLRHDFARFVENHRSFGNRVL